MRDHFENGTHSDHVLFENVPYISLVVISSLIICTGALMNIFVIFAYATRRIRRSDFNSSMVHLSVSSICQYIGCLPYLYMSIRDISQDGTFLNEYILPGITCGISLFFCFAYVSVWILSYMTIKRYLAIMYPIETYRRKGSGNRILVALWLVAFPWITPHHLSWKCVPHEDICERSTHIFSETFLKIYGGLMFLLGLIVPVVTMVICLFRIKRKLYTDSSSTNIGAEIAKLKHRQKIVLLMLALVFVFCISWAPWALYWIVRISKVFEGSIETEYTLASYRKILILPCLMAGILNPIVYGHWGSGFSLKQLLLTHRARVSSKLTNIRPNPSKHDQLNTTVVETWCNSRKELKQSGACVVSRERGETQSTVASSYASHSSLS